MYGADQPGRLPHLTVLQSRQHGRNRRGRDHQHDRHHDKQFEQRDAPVRCRTRVDLSSSDFACDYFFSPMRWFWMLSSQPFGVSPPTAV